MSATDATQKILLVSLFAKKWDSAAQGVDTFTITFGASEWATAQTTYWTKPARPDKCLDPLTPAAEKYSSFVKISALSLAASTAMFNLC